MAVCFFFRRLLLMLVAALACTACRASLDDAHTAEKVPLYFHHTVTFRNENLSIIALWYTGSTNAWQELRALNGNMDPVQMRIGQQIQIPIHLLIRNDPLPEEFVQRMSRLQARGAYTRGRRLQDPAAALLEAPASSPTPTPAAPGEAAAQGQDDARDKLFRALVDE